MNTKRPILFLLVILFCGYNIKAQEAIQNKLSPLEYKPTIIELGKSFPSSLHKFIFIDEREDTTRMGFFWGTNRQYYFMFPKPAAIYLNEKINSKKGNIPIDTLYVGIKRLWISQVNLPPSVLRTFLVNSFSTVGYCNVICNFYKKRDDTYYLLYTYNSINSKNGYLGNIHDKLIENNLLAMALVADSISDIKNIPPTAQRVYQPGIKQNKPAILTSQKLNDGIYLSFEDFLNDRPVKLTFDYIISDAQEKIKLAEIRNDDSIFTQLSWGFCKNNTAYIRIGSRFSKLTKVEETFELRAVESLQNRYGKDVDAFWLGFDIARDLRSGFPIFALSDIISHKKTPEAILRTMPFKLDIETGKVY